MDMVSTYFMAVFYSDEFREVNQNFSPTSLDFLVVNAVFLLVFSAAVMIVLIDWITVKKYLRETAFITYAKELISKKYFRRKDFVSLKIISLVSILVTVGAIGGGRFLAFINNLMEYLGYSGFMSHFLTAFPIHEQLAVHIVFTISVFPLFPISYLLLRLVVR